MCEQQQGYTGRPFNRRGFMRGAIAAGVTPALLAGVGTAAESRKRRRPNVLFILTDDQRWDTIGLAGSKHLKTPNIDRLGREGVYFKNAFCTTSLCSPSRATILSACMHTRMAWWTTSPSIPRI